MINQQSTLTAEIPFDPSPHGELRRRQRRISVRDLKAAVKYGKKERGYPCPRSGESRWKFTYMDVVYITDMTCEKEVTSYALDLPLDEIKLSQSILSGVSEAKKRICANPGIITAHTVLVVDQSASMKSSDTNGHRTRSRAVYFSIAVELIASRLPSVERAFGDSYTEVVSLIEMHSESEIVLSCEPISWELYNKVVKLSKENRASSHGNYFPAMELALDQLEKIDHEQCALSLFFLSDGRPSDRSYGYGDFPENIYDLIEEAGERIGTRLTFMAIGFGAGGSNEDFSALNDMVEVARGAGIRDSTFTTGDSTALNAALSTVINSSTSLVTKLSRLTFAVGEDKSRIKSKAEKKLGDHMGLIRSVSSGSWLIFHSNMSVDFQSKRNKYVYEKLIREYGSIRWIGRMKQTKPFQHASATGFAVEKEFFGQGAERIVFRMTELDEYMRPIGVPMVAKESRWLLALDEKRASPAEFHDTFIRTQMKASNLANRFNQYLDSRGVSSRIPRVSFLDCSVYVTDQVLDSEGFPLDKAYMIEKKLLGHYIKFNDNAGKVDGISFDNGQKQFNQLLTGNTAGLMSVMEEGDEDEEDEEDKEDEEDEDEDEEAEDSKAYKAASTSEFHDQILDQDVPQAFTHWTYVHSKRRMMVCDLQGVLDYSNGSKPIFEFTDPCIHYCDDEKTNYRRRKKSFGRTDRGFEGCQAFCKTHQCNALCKLLGIDFQARNSCCRK